MFSGIKLVVLCNFPPTLAVQCAVTLRVANMQLLSPLVAAGSEVHHYVRGVALLAIAAADRAVGTTTNASQQRNRAYVQYTLRDALPPRALRVLAVLSCTTSGARDAGVPADIQAHSHAEAKAVEGVEAKSAVVDIASAAYRREAVVPMNAAADDDDNDGDEGSRSHWQTIFFLLFRTLKLVTN